MNWVKQGLEEMRHMPALPHASAAVYLGAEKKMVWVIKMKGFRKLCRSDPKQEPRRVGKAFSKRQRHDAGRSARKSTGERAGICGV